MKGDSPLVTRLVVSERDRCLDTVRQEGGIVAGLALSPPQFQNVAQWNFANQDRLHFHEPRIRQGKRSDRDLVWITVTADLTAEKGLGIK
jgi:hypothetical protein